MLKKAAFFTLALTSLCATATIADAQTGPAPMDHQGMGHEKHGPGDQGPGGHGHHSPQEMFARMDTNHDGVISKAEFDQAHQHMMEHRGEHHGGLGGPGGPGMGGMQHGPQGTPPQR